MQVEYRDGWLVPTTPSTSIYTAPLVEDNLIVPSNVTSYRFLSTWAAPESFLGNKVRVQRSKESYLWHCLIQLQVDTLEWFPDSLGEVPINFEPILVKGQTLVRGKSYGSGSPKTTHKTSQCKYILALPSILEAYIYLQEVSVSSEIRYCRVHL